MPRVSAAHEQEVRERIVSAAIRVFTERGYGATIQDVVRDSGLSVGAIYTYFKSKEELFLACCEMMTSGSLETLGHMIAGKATTAERLETATRFYIDSIDTAPEGGPGLVTLVQAWAVAEGEPRIREMLARRRERFVGAGQVLLREGVARGELPPWLDVDATARALHLAARRAAPAADRGRRALPPGRPRAAGARDPRPGSCRSPRTRLRAEHHAGVASPGGLRPDGPRANRPVRARHHASARAHPDRAVAHRIALGLLAADARRAGDPRRARAVPVGRRTQPRRPHVARRRTRSRRGSQGSRRHRS